MAPGSFRFDRFTLDPADRRLTHDGAPVELSARYFDALALLVREQGRLVSKDRFHDEVWRGIPVTDEALTQCIRTLRRALGDDAASPRFIETVPKHGYRFVAAVDGDVPTVTASIVSPPLSSDWRPTLLLGTAGTVGGGLAGVIGGVLYGFVGASPPLGPGMGALSVLLVLMCLTIIVALTGGAGVAFGIAIAERWYGRPVARVIGGAIGGLAVGALVKLLGLDAFNLLFGQSPGEITGAMEGLIVGAGAGLGAWLAGERLRIGITIAAATGAAAGLLVSLLGGRLMSGSLSLVVQHFPNSRLRLDRIGSIFGEPDFGPIAQAVTAALESGLFAACLVGAMIVTRRDLRR